MLRYRPEQEDAPVWQRYTVPYTDDMSVLQALQHIKDELDGTLSFRWSCRMAICGSCGMMVNGKPALSCQTFVRDLLPGPVRIEALAHFPIERDLVVSVEGFVQKLEGIKPYIDSQEAAHAGARASTCRRRRSSSSSSSSARASTACCATPPARSSGSTPTFTGPGVLALLHRYNADSRDGGRAQRMEVLNAEEGVWSCTAVGYCSEVCPKHVDPANAVNQNKVNSAKDYFLRFLSPKGAA